MNRMLEKRAELHRRRSRGSLPRLWGCEETTCLGTKEKKEAFRIQEKYRFLWKRSEIVVILVLE